MNFFQKNCHAFSDAGDENAHSTKNIHEEFIQLIDTAIEAQLLQFHTEEQVQSFYKAFPDNFRVFEEQNEEAFNILGATLDFEKFKAQMTHFKTGVVDDIKTVKTFDKEVYSFDNLIKEPLTGKDCPWKKVVTKEWDHENGVDGWSITVHQRPKEDDSGLLLIRMDVIYKNCQKEW